MKKIISFFIIILLLSYAGLSAVTPEDFGITILTSRTENGINILSAENQNGDKFSITVKGDLSETQIKLIHLAEDTFFNWINMEIDSLKIVFDNGKAGVIVNLSALNYSNINLAEYLPSGIQFYYDTFFEYDFRMYVDNLFLRLKGQLLGEEELIKKIYEASINPILFLQTQDPEYLVRQIMAINETIKTITTENEEERETMAKTIADLDSSLTALEADNITLQAENKTLIDEITTIKENNETQKTAFELLQYALIGLNNKGFLGLSLKPFDSSAIDKIVAVKVADTSLGSDGIFQKLTENGETPDKKLITLVLITFFNEFEQD